MRFLNKILALCLSFTFTFSNLNLKIFGSSNTKKIDIISINDFHGALLNNGENDKNPGAARIITSLNKLKEENKNTIVVSAGDNFNGSSVSNLLYGEPVIKFFKEAEINLSAVGNHEFDWGTDKIENWSKDIQFLSANIERKDKKEITWSKPYEIIEKDGIKIGFIGIATPETAYKSDPKFVNDFNFLSPEETAKKYVPIVKKEGADIVILLTHIGSFQNEETKEITFEEDSKGIENAKSDGIITGHSHKPVFGKINEIPVVQALYNGRALGKLSFEVDTKTKKIIKSESSIIEIYKDNKNISENIRMIELLKPYIKAVEPILNKEIGILKDDLTRSYEENSSLGQFLTKIMLEESKADISVLNAGSIREDFKKGSLKMSDLYATMPFDNILTTVEMQGSSVKELFEYGLKAEVGHIQFSGAKIFLDKDKKITKIILNNGEELDLKKTYKVVTNDFLASGGDNYSMFKNKDVRLVSETLIIRDLTASEILKSKNLDFKVEKNIIKQ